jgi:NAD+ kinase
MTQFKTVALWGRLSEASVAEPAQQILAHLQKRGIQVLADSDAEARPPLSKIKRLGRTELAASVDLIVAVGGDGTLLTAARLVAAHGVPLIGVNRGRLGFLTDVSPEHMLDALDAILSGDYLAEQRRLLRASIVPDEPDSAASVPAMLALNDVVLQKGETGRMIDFVTTVDGSYVNTHRGDGLIVATPTGSTAYALSCGGPIIQPNVDAVVMVPICPHTLSDRPVVLKDSSRIEVHLDADGGDTAYVMCDGEELGAIDTRAKLAIQVAEETVTLLHPREYDYYQLLRSKLNWGRANNGRAPRRA